jgi:hypothetical protein
MVTVDTDLSDVEVVVVVREGAGDCHVAVHVGALWATSLKCTLPTVFVTKSNFTNP